MNTGDFREANELAGKYGALNRSADATYLQAVASAGLGMRGGVALLLHRVERLPHTSNGLALVVTVAAAAAQCDRAFVADDVQWGRPTTLLMRALSPSIVVLPVSA